MKESLKIITKCEVCGNNDLDGVLELGNHAMCDDLVKLEDNRVPEKYPISILFCKKCKTAHQQYQVPKTILFPESYHYRAALTKDVLNGMKNLVDSCESNMGDLKNRKVLDIGCNDGSLLDYFKDKGSVTFGIEPTNAVIDAKSKKHTVIQDYFCKDVAVDFVKKYGKPDLITFTNVFAHIEDLDDVLAGLSALFNENTCLVIENHYLGAILEFNQFDTFYHEHPRTYSFTSFKYIANKLDMHIADVVFPSRYGGNIRIFMSRKENLDINFQLEKEIVENESSFELAFNKLAENMNKWRARKKFQLLDEIENNGKLRAKAFPGRAAILLELLGLTEEHISAVYEQPASPKVGCYVPGTRIPILSDNDLDKSDLSPMINLAWHIQNEIENHMKNIGYSGKLIPIVAQDDFV